MVTDVHPSSLSGEQYTYALNSNTETQNGDGINLTNEDSNILCSNFLEGFQVIGFQRDITAEKTYLYLVNTSTGESEIGSIDELVDQVSFTDTVVSSACDCDSETVLANGLETIDQQAVCTYQTLISDYDCSDIGATQFTFAVNPTFSITPAEFTDFSGASVDNTLASGTGASFRVYTSADGLSVVSVEVLAQGSGYQTGDTIILLGSGFSGGSTPADDVILTLTNNSCLNFNINFPVSSELKDEKCGKVLYFTDDLNPRRRIELDNLGQYLTRTVECDPDSEGCNSCGTKEIDACINCDKMRVMLIHEPLCIQPEGLTTGGQVRHGQYAFFVGYSDSQGNLMTNISGATTAFSVKDLNKNTYQQPELDDVTNQSIKLTIDNLSTEFDFYKVIVLQRSSVDGANAFYTVGVYPTSQKTVVFTGESNLARSDINEITRILPDYTVAKSVEQANNILFYSDLEATPDPPLQKVVNFMGQFANWRTITGNEDLYSLARGNALFVGYMRDEVVPFGIRFKTNTGYTTPLYPFIARHVESVDPEVNGGIINTGKEDVLFDSSTYSTLLTQIAEIEDFTQNDDATTGWQTDVYSILTTGSQFCASSDRNQKWQFYNTGCAPKTSGYVFTDFGAADASRAQGFYTSVATTTSGSGTGMTLDIQVDANGKVDSITVVNNGTGYAEGDTITVSGAALGGATPTNDYTFSIAYIYTANSETDLWKACLNLSDYDLEEKQVTRSCSSIQTEVLPEMPQAFPLIIEDPESDGVETLEDWFRIRGASNSLPNGYITGVTTGGAFSTTPNSVVVINSSEITGGSGSGASFTVTVDGTGSAVASLEMTSGGSGYAVSDGLTVSSGAASGLTFTVTAVSDFQTAYNNLVINCATYGDGICDPADLFDGCSSFVTKDSYFIFSNIFPTNTGDEIITNEVYLDCSERDANGGSVHYPRLSAPINCSIYNIAIDSSGNQTGSSLNDSAFYDYWLKRADTSGTDLSFPLSIPSGCDPEDFPCTTYNSGNLYSSGCTGVGGCAPACKHPAYFERLTNYLNNTSKGNAYEITPIAFNNVSGNFFITPFFDLNTSSDLCDGGATNQIETSFATSVPAISLTNAQFLTAVGGTNQEDIVVSFVNNAHSSGKAPDSVCGANCGYDERDVEAHFKSNVHVNAVWYKVTNVEEDTTIINISNLIDPYVKFKDCLIYSRYLRLTVVDSSNNLLSVNGSSSTVALIDLYSNGVDDGVFCVDTTGLTPLLAMLILLPTSKE